MVSLIGGLGLGLFKAEEIEPAFEDFAQVAGGPAGGEGVEVFAVTAGHGGLPVVIVVTGVVGARGRGGLEPFGGDVVSAIIGIRPISKPWAKRSAIPVPYLKLPPSVIAV